MKGREGKDVKGSGEKGKGRKGWEGEEKVKGGMVVKGEGVLDLNICPGAPSS